MKPPEQIAQEFIDKIEQAIFDLDEPGCRDTDTGDMCFTEIGRIRIARLLAEREAETWEEAARISLRIHGEDSVTAALRERGRRK